MTGQTKRLWFLPAAPCGWPPAGRPARTGTWPPPCWSGCSWCWTWDLAGRRALWRWGGGPAWRGTVWSRWPGPASPGRPPTAAHGEERRTKCRWQDGTLNTHLEPRWLNVHEKLELLPSCDYSLHPHAVADWQTLTTHQDKDSESKTYCTICAEVNSRLLKYQWYCAQ